MSPVVEVSGLRKAYGDQMAVRDVSFAIERGEIFGLIGPNGSGKTTTVECVQGLRARDGGQVRVLGLDPADEVAALRRRIGSQLQDSALPDRITVSEALRLFSSGASDPDRWRTLIDQWGLSEKRSTRFADLSGGQQQRLLIALALVHSPELVFLDEMATGLDPAARRNAWQLVEQLRDGGMTVVLVTHFMDEASRLCDRIAVVRSGRIVAIDTPDGLVSRLAPDVVVEFGVDEPVDLDWLGAVPGVREHHRAGRHVRVIGSGAVAVSVAHHLAEHGLYPDDFTVRRGTLEEVYLDLTDHDQPDGHDDDGDGALR
jgi:ABC-2 type transport system ATP-binding protein